MPLFQKVQNGPSSYVAGQGFAIRAAEYEKIESASVMMDPQTKLGTSAIPALVLSISGSSVMVRVYQAFPADPTARDWAEIDSGTDLNAAKFILTGVAY
ncbi:MAG: hypothetical protein WC551_08090 [Patescibacteria group bacterium]